MEGRGFREIGGFECFVRYIQHSDRKYLVDVNVLFWFDICFSSLFLLLCVFFGVFLILKFL